MNKYRFIIVIIALSLIFYSNENNAQVQSENITIEKSNPSLNLTNTNLNQWTSSRLYFSNQYTQTKTTYGFLAERYSSGENNGGVNFILRKNTPNGYLNFINFKESNDIIFQSGNTSGQQYGNTIFRSGKVGIGLLSPEEKLHVSGVAMFQRASGGSNYLKIHSTSHASYLTSDDPGTNQKHMVLQVSPTSDNAEDRHLILKTGKKDGVHQTRMRILGNGKVAVGNHAPSAQLDVKGHSNGYDGYNFIVRDEYGNDDFKIRGTGQVEIGYQTTIHNSSHYLLAVGGGAFFEEVKVKLEEAWPDYVFEENFKLQDLSELETYIKKNKHLPGIPTAQEVEDNDGIELGEMNRLLLEKIEELSLYVIELKKENEVQNEKINLLMNKE